MKFRAFLKLPLVTMAVLGHLAHTYFFHLITSDPILRRRRFCRCGKLWTGIFLKICGVRVTLINPPTGSKRHLIISNHMGFLDVMVLLSKMDAVFVTSKEIQETPFLGLMCEMGGALFIERRSRANIRQEIETVATTLENGFDVVIYPEGTSSNGERILPFKKSFLVACAGTSASLMPTALNYRKVNGEPMSHVWRDHVCWYGDQSFFPSLMRLLSLKSVEAEIRFLDEIHIHSEEERRHVAETAQSQIEAHFMPIKNPDLPSTTIQLAGSGLD